MSFAAPAAFAMCGASWHEWPMSASKPVSGIGAVAARQDIHNSDLPVLCQSCEARHKGICGTLSPDQLLRLSKHTSKHVLEPEQPLPSPDSDRFANILKGIVKLTKLTRDGRQQIVGLQFAPDFLGRPYGRQPDVTAEAVTEVKVCSFPRRFVEKLIEETPELEHMLYQQALRELDEARDWMLTLGRKTAPEKVAAFFYLLAVRFNPEESGDTGRATFEIPMKRADIADFLGLTIETVSRQITKLRQAKVIVLLENRMVEVPDLARLRALTEQSD